jgi:hypothetical protein
MWDHSYERGEHDPREDDMQFGVKMEDVMEEREEDEREE